MATSLKIKLLLEKKKKKRVGEEMELIGLALS